MPTLADTFRNYEVDHLEMIAEQWGIDGEIDWRHKPLNQIVSRMSDETLFAEIIDTLPESSRAAFDRLANLGGKMTRAQFSRSFGELRDFGAGLRGKERPDRNPVSAVELLFYRGLIGLAFFDEDDEAKEYFYIPDEFLQFSEGNQSESFLPFLIESEGKEILPLKMSSFSLLDLICMRLAIRRGEIPAAEYSRIISEDAFPFIDGLLRAHGVFNAYGESLNTNSIKDILLKNCSILQIELFDTWKNNKEINELRILPRLMFEGNWKNDPLKPRRVILNLIDMLPMDRWIFLDDFIDWVHNENPDFLRSGGEYEQWFIKNADDNSYLKGFASWQQIEGRLIKFYIKGPLQWFGILTFGVNNSDPGKLAFQKSEIATDLFSGSDWICAEDSIKEIAINKNGEVLLPRPINREMCYQIARLLEWTGINETYYKFKINPLSLNRAEKQKITFSQFKLILQKYGKPPIPQNIFTALDRWETGKSKIVLREDIVIRFDHKDALKSILNSPMKKLIREELNPTTVVIRKQDVSRFEQALIENGYLLENLSKYNERTK